MATSHRGLARLHTLAQWVITLDRFANRESLTHAVGPDVAILHQERRASRQCRGGHGHQPAGRCERRPGNREGACADSDRRNRRLRPRAGPAPRCCGYGDPLRSVRLLPGQASNELIGHVAGFNRLTTTATPWPLPAACRVLLLSLDEYADGLVSQKGRHAGAGTIARRGRSSCCKRRGKGSKGRAFRSCGNVRGKRTAQKNADRLPIRGLSGKLPVLETVAQPYLRGDGSGSAGERVDERDLLALDQFRRGDGVLEWAGIGMVFAPGTQERTTHTTIPLMRDRRAHRSYNDRSDPGPSPRCDGERRHESSDRRDRTLGTALPRKDEDRNPERIRAGSTRRRARRCRKHFARH